MLKNDAEQLATQLNALAETYEKKAVSPKALAVWFDVLKEFPTERVLGVLIGWPKFKTRFPSPAEVWKDCNEQGIKEREEKAAFERKQNMGEPEFTGPTEHGRRMAAMIREILNRPKIPWKQRWEEMLANPNSTDLQRRFATEALQNLGHLKKPQRERVPGEDDEPEMGTNVPALGIPLDALEQELMEAANP